MKEQGKDDAVLSGCGMWVTVVGPRGAYSFPSLCKRWMCTKCRKILIKILIDKIQGCFGELPCVQVFVGYSKEKGKELSNFTSKNVNGHYCRINGVNTSVIISDKKFNGAERNDKIKFLRKTLPEILNQPWEKGKRVSFSLGWIEPHEKEESNNWVMIVGDVCDEFHKLNSDEEKKAWLLKQIILRRYKKGAKFLE